MENKSALLDFPPNNNPLPLLMKLLLFGTHTYKGSHYSVDWKLELEPESC